MKKCVLFLLFCFGIVFTVEGEVTVGLLTTFTDPALMLSVTNTDITNEIDIIGDNSCEFNIPTHSVIGAGGITREDAYKNDKIGRNHFIVYANRFWLESDQSHDRLINLFNKKFVIKINTVVYELKISDRQILLTIIPPSKLLVDKNPQKVEPAIRVSSKEYDSIGVDNRGPTDATAFYQGKPIYFFLAKALMVELAEFLEFGLFDTESQKIIWVAKTAINRPIITSYLVMDIDTLTITSGINVRDKTPITWGKIKKY